MTEAERERLAELCREADDLRQKLSLAERRVAIATATLRQYADHDNWAESEHGEYIDMWLETDNGWEPAEKALVEINEAK